MTRPMKQIVFGILLLAVIGFALTAMASWRVSEDYVIQFSGSGAEGTFSGLSGSVMFDPKDLSSSKFDVTVEASTISTGNKTKDKHARGKSWLDVEKYPYIKFTSSQVTQSGYGYEMTGELELHGVTKKMTIPFSFSQSGDTGRFEGTFTVNRKDFEITGPFFGFVVGDEFEVTLKVPVQAPK